MDGFIALLIYLGYCMEAFGCVRVEDDYIVVLESVCESGAEFRDDHYLCVLDVNVWKGRHPCCVYGGKVVGRATYLFTGLH